MPSAQQLALYGAGALGALLLARKALSPAAKLPPNPVVVLTGCDVGIANETVKILAGLSKGYLIYAGCLTEKGQKDLDALQLPNVKTFIVDVTKDDSVAAMKAFMKNECSEASGRNLFVIWNIAGILRGFISEFNSIEDWRAVFEVNVFGVWRATTALQPLLRRTAKKYPYSAGYAKARVITITSVAAELVFPAGSIYNSSKHAAAGLMSTLRLELANFGIAVVQVQPWFAKSALFDVLNAREAEKIKQRVSADALADYGGEDVLKAAGDKEVLVKAVPMLQPADVAKTMIEQALLPSNPAPHVVVGTLGKVMLALRRLLPYETSDKLLNLKA